MATEFTFNHSNTLNGGGKQVGASNRSFTGSAQQAIEEDVANGSTDYQINMSIDQSEMVAFAIISTQNVTVETNSGSSPTDTFTLTANVPKIYLNDSSQGSNFITADVTAFFITNSSGSTATVSIISLTDATP